MLAAQEPDGRFHNRRQSGPDLVGHGVGRGLLGPRALGARHGRRSRVPHLRERALAGFDAALACARPHPRAMAFAALGAAEVLAVLPDHREARALMTAAAIAVGRPARRQAWPWPEPRLSYANAVLPEALLAAGARAGLALARRGRPRPAGAGCSTSSPRRAPVRRPGRGVADRARPARHSTSSRSRWRRWPTRARRAYLIDGQAAWAEGIELAAAWFLGDNDSGTPMHDPVTGGGFDGLERFGRNENQGAESTLALLSTLQQARSMARHARRTTRRSMKVVAG